MNFWKGKSVLITGGAGFIGSHLARTLLKQGAHICISDNLSSGSLDNIKDILNDVEVKITDLRDRDVCKNLTRNKDYIFHMAANMGGIGYITKIGADIMRDNLFMNINMLQSSLENNISKFFYSSSACIYPIGLQKIPEIIPLKEEDAIPAEPNEFYGWEKLTTEKLCEAYHKDYGLEVRIARFHNIFGEAYTSFDHERGKAPGHLIKKALLYPEERFVLWGDGKQTRSFLYIEDCIEGIFKIMESDYDKPLNIGSDRLVTIDELARIIINISRKNIKVEHDLTRPQGVRGRNADLTLIKKILGWKPKITLDEGLKRTYKWAETRLELINKLS